MSKTVTLEEINSWRHSGNYPEWASTFAKRDRYFSYKRNPNAKPLLSVKDLHPHALQFCHFIKTIISEDVCITGSWVNGTFCHPEVTPEYCKIRKEIGKQDTSDFDLYFPNKNLQEAQELCRQIGKEHGLKVDAVEWWGSGINIRTDEVVACNPENKLGPVVKRQYKNHYSESELSKIENLLNNELPR